MSYWQPWEMDMNIEYKPGPMTKDDIQRLKRYQKLNNLKVDGIAKHQTVNTMLDSIRRKESTINDLSGLVENLSDDIEGLQTKVRYGILASAGLFIAVLVSVFAGIL